MADVHRSIERSAGFDLDFSPSTLIAVHYATAAVAFHFSTFNENVAGTAGGAAEHVRNTVANAAVDDFDDDLTDALNGLEENDAWHRRTEEESSAQCNLLRDIFGNPFRPVTFSPEWRTGTALTLAQQMYDSRDFSAMPILADALQDAGCASADILDHCRQPGVHVRGCWVLDLALEKA